MSSKTRRSSAVQAARNDAGNLGAIIEGLVDLIAERVVQKLGGDGSDWVDQSASPLGPRRHRRAVNDRLASGRPGASRIGRKCLLSREALAEELAAKGRKKSTPDEGESVEERLRRELGLEASR